ncbi:MAG: homoserine kinase [Gammaproteobacteria bacterium]|nr:homoserine kinase [Gammaproteobacteria bacterium]
MSVFTTVSTDELSAFLRDYDLGALTGMRGTTSGVENTNYFVSTTAGEYVLTLFESTPAEDLPFFIGVMDHLAAHDVPSPAPYPDRNGRFLRTLNGRPAIVVRRLHGAAVETPGAAQLAQVGDYLSRIHLSGAGEKYQRNDPRGVQWRAMQIERLRPVLARDEFTALQREVELQAAIDDSVLPCGILHADLFRDNVLFSGHVLSGILDFYYACSGSYLYDLAVTINDWCFDDHDAWHTERCGELLSNYQARRTLNDAEWRMLPLMLRRAALRFLLSRLGDWHFPREGELIQKKDPARFRRILALHQSYPDLISAAD